MEYYSAIKGEAILPFETAWMDLEGIILSEISQHKRTNTVWFHLYEVPSIVEFIDMESRRVVTREQGKGE